MRKFIKRYIAYIDIASKTLSAIVISYFLLVFMGLLEIDVYHYAFAVLFILTLVALLICCVVDTVSLLRK